MCCEAQKEAPDRLNLFNYLKKIDRDSPMMTHVCVVHLLWTVCPILLNMYDFICLDSDAGCRLGCLGGVHHGVWW